MKQKCRFSFSAGSTAVFWILLIAIGSVFPLAAFADEAWMSKGMTIEWETSIEDTAVFSFKTPDLPDSTTRMFIENLVPDTSGYRGTYTGYWVDDSKRETCSASLTGLSGASTKSWGRVEISFAPDGNYWEWTARIGDCFDQLREKIVAKPIKGAPDTSAETDPVRILAMELSRAYRMRALDNLDEGRAGEGEIEVIIEHSLGEGEIEKSKFYDFEQIERDFRRNEYEPGFPNRETEKLLECKDGTCRYDVKGLLHNTLFLTKMTYGMKDGKPFIKAIYILNGD